MKITKGIRRILFKHWFYVW